MTLDPKALEALKNHQRQLDMDGCTCLEVFGEDPNCPVHSYEALENRILDLESLIEAQHGDVVFRTAKLLYSKDARIAELEAERVEALQLLADSLLDFAPVSRENHRRRVADFIAARPVVKEAGNADA